jgi:predicted N-acyltransferase
VQLEVLDNFGGIDASEWDTLVGDASPFLEHTFLRGLETHGCAIPKTGWTARPIVVRDGGTLVAAAPAWRKDHSMGEFVYDHGWADAARRAGLRYYPKLVVAVPFTPVAGPRLLVRDGLPRHDEALATLAAGLEQASKGCHGLHVLFDTEGEADWLAARGAFTRLQFQFHWHNEGFGTFEDWLGTLPAKKRNKIRRERKSLGGIRIVSETNPSPEILDALHRFYRNTASQFGPWGHVYLSREFYRHLGATWGERLHTVTAWDGDRIVAGAFNVVKGGRLYGRTWGCDTQVPFLHFEVCYYAAIEACIRQGWTTFEPGHGGGHKYRRGFRPIVTRSSHRLADPRLHEALRRYTLEETAEVEARIEELTSTREA